MAFLLDYKLLNFIGYCLHRPKPFHPFGRWVLVEAAAVVAD